MSQTRHQVHVFLKLMRLILTNECREEKGGKGADSTTIADGKTTVNDDSDTALENVSDTKDNGEKGVISEDEKQEEETSYHNGNFDSLKEYDASLDLPIALRKGIRSCTSECRQSVYASSL
ncbi:uncharacterized protein LOC120070075 isoform X2 [Benincasa hispida]|uniref:uncharacterized protein LOC120070075 isoform X2 n=1 Tax=Benincasa hispida TaxID=102211 RepID=UPI001900F1ED|nr:uncharacterized protein LOC120070075 isoform X2 [Benincasa hispida]